MFLNAAAFNRDISSWDVRKVTNFYWTFAGAVIFNQDISIWKPQSAITFERIFKGATQMISTGKCSTINTMWIKPTFCIDSNSCTIACNELTL